MHGESGVGSVHLCSARNAVKQLLDYRTNPASATKIELTDGEHLTVILNNLCKSNLKTRGAGGGEGASQAVGESWVQSGQDVHWAHDDLPGDGWYPNILAEGDRLPS